MAPDVAGLDRFSYGVWMAKERWVSPCIAPRSLAVSALVCAPSQIAFSHGTLFCHCDLWDRVAAQGTAASDHPIARAATSPVA